MKHIYYAILNRDDKLVNHRIHWDTGDGVMHFVPAVFNTQEEAMKYKMDDMKVVQINLKVKDKLRYL